MASRINNICGGFTVIVASRKEFMAATDTFANCHLCGDEVYLEDCMYYIPMLDVIYCERCYALWQASNPRYYKVDKDIEIKNFEQMKARFLTMEDWDD